VSISLSELARRTGAELQGDGERGRHCARGDARAAGADAIAFLSNPRYRAQLSSTRAAAVIVAPAMRDATTLPKLVSGNPYALYAQGGDAAASGAPHAPGTHPTAVIDSTRPSPRERERRCSCGDRRRSADRDPVCASVRARRDRRDVAIGDDALLHANVTIYDPCASARATSCTAAR
jgi:UDP-3-O-[3-hydroxymyristoyl] glucosamine N-acyltransferase